MFEGGLPILTIVQLLKDDFLFLSEVYRRMTDEGQTFGEALEGFIPESYAKSISVAEKSGKLTENLKELSETLKREESVHSQVKNAMIKPIVAITISVAVALYFPAYVVPEFKAVFGEEVIKPNFFTNILFFMSDIVGGNPLLIIGIVSAVPISLFYLFTKQQKLVGKLPVFDDIFYNEKIISMLQTLKNLLSAGLPLSRVIEEMDYLYPDEGFAIAGEKIRVEGVSFGDAVESLNIFPPYVCRLIMSTEKAGKLEDGLKTAIDIANLKLESATKKVDPVLTLVTAGVMAVIVIVMFVGMYAPIYEAGANIL